MVSVGSMLAEGRGVEGGDGYASLTLSSIRQRMRGVVATHEYSTTDHDTESAITQILVLQPTALGS